MATKYYRGVSIDEMENERWCGCGTKHRSWQAAISCMRSKSFSWERVLAVEITKNGYEVRENGFPVYKTEDL